MSAAPDLCTLSPYLSLADVLSDPTLSGDFNSDVLGYGHTPLRFRYERPSWGDTKDSEAALQTLLIQIGSIVLCTMLSVVRGQLTFFDGLFTLTVVHSPIVWYILWINGREIYSWTRKVPRHISVNAVLCLAVVFGWVSLNLVVWFKGRRFPGENCGSISFTDYLSNVVLPATPIYSLQASVYFWAPGPNYVTNFVVFGWVLYMVRYRSRRLHPNVPATLSRRIFTLFKSYVVLGFFVGKRHTWLIFLYVSVSYFYWSSDIALWSVESGFNLSYGQSLSLIAAVPSLVSVFKLAWDLRKLNRAEIRCAVTAEVLFFWCGNGQLVKWINRKYFDNKLALLSPMEPSLPTTRPPTPPSLLSNPTVTVGSGPTVRSARSSAHIGDEECPIQSEGPDSQSQSSLQASTSTAGQGRTQCSSADIADVFNGYSVTHSIAGPMMLAEVLPPTHTAEEMHNSSIPRSESLVEMLVFERLGAALSSVNEEQEPMATAGSSVVDQFNDVHDSNSSNNMLSRRKDYGNGEIRSRTFLGSP
ncbi:hypothetical protein C8F04DRAFT_1268733 [Mycena alexandri]|uniref:Transmembrane protein n=1 Tax=Mycena alexandri TaxID=1745969 RepID=A0AAD6SI26_9AGAR|nr:hypothetical protein C8F04DRAFT_1268733 [Mycena alexandri]